MPREAPVHRQQALFVLCQPRWGDSAHSSMRTSSASSGWLYLTLAAAILATAWVIPARWRSVHPRVLDVAGRGSARLTEVALGAARHQQVGVATRLNTAAIELGLPGTQEVQDAIAAATTPESRILGGPDPVLAALLPRPLAVGATNTLSALDLFLPAPHRTSLLQGLSSSRSPGVQALLRTRDLALGQFPPAGQPGGQALDTAVLLAAALYERERLSPEFARDLREQAEQAPTSASARQTLETFYLNLISLARRMDWSSLAELTRAVGSLEAFDQFAGACRSHPADQSLLFAGALLSGNAGGVARQRTEWAEAGRQGLRSALQHGSRAVVRLAQDDRPVRPGGPTVDLLASAVVQAPEAWTAIRSGLMFLAAALGALGLRAFSRAGLPADAIPASEGWPALMVTTLLVSGFLILASEPLPSRPNRKPSPSVRLDLQALTKSSPAANSSHSQRKFMEPTTLVTMAIFGAIQLAVYVICVRKIREISRLPEPPSVRLRLLENEENLFDSGLYVGIGGTAAALVMQVLQLVEANLLAAYSSNLMGIICVAVVKIGHVRNARRQLILESLEAPEPAADALAAPNPFTTR